MQMASAIQITRVVDVDKNEAADSSEHNKYIRDTGKFLSIGRISMETDLLIQSQPGDIENKEDKALNSEKCGQVRQNPQTGRKQK